MTCSACGTANDQGRKFCKECGAPLALACPSCGSPNSADSKFCGECGSPIPGGRPASAAAEAPAGRGLATERRLVTVLFADLVGSTSLAEHRDAEDVRELLSRYFEAARAAIERHGGVIEKFIGDAVMAVWGTPVAHEDDAERAVRAALELLDAVRALGGSVGAALRARAGVLTGEAAATLGASGEGLVAGDMVNTASRLQSAAEPGMVLVGEATYRAASRAVAFEDAGELTLKGREEPVRAWRALRVVAQRGGTVRGSAIEPPFVGRAEELRLVKDQFHAAGREGKARLVSLMGIAGIGKSRLAWEFEKYTDGLTEDAYWHEGRCPAYGDGVSFWALGEMVRMRARIAETDTPDESRRKLRATVEDFVPDAEERRWIEPRLGHLLGLEERPPGESEELFAAWRAFFERIAERGTAVMVFEDLQWADTGLLDFIGSLTEWSRNRPILILTLSRPELVDRRPDWGAAQRAFTSIRLEPLPDDAIEEMVRGFVRGLPDEGVARIVARAEGVPLYAVETVRMLADRGILEPREDAYEVIGDIVDLEVPDTLHALIAARLDALSPEDRSLLQDAAVLGKSFTVDALSAVSGASREVLEPRLRDLVRKELLRYEADPRSPERGQYGFVQGLIREVSYSTLAKAERRRRHLATAHHFESLGDDELAGVVASHYAEAYRATPRGPDAEALAARARDWLGQAADRAASLGSPEQALGYLEQALEITPGGAERASLLEKAGRAASDAARADRSVALLEEAITLSRDAGDLAAVARQTAFLGDSLTNGQGRGSEARDRMRAVLDEAGDRIDEEARARLLASLAQTDASLGRPEECLTLLEEALPIVERAVGDELADLFSDAIQAKAWALTSLGRHREAAMLARGLLDLAERAGSARRQADALIYMGVVVAEDDPRRALAHWLEAAELARRAGVRGTELSALTNAAEAANDVGEWETSDRVIEELNGHPELPSHTRISLGFVTAQLAAFRGDHPRAMEELEAVSTSSLGSDFLQMRTWFERTRSTVLLVHGELREAYDAARAAVEEDPAGINSPNASKAMAHAALWMRDAEKARAAVDAMAPLRGRWMGAARRAARAGIAALEGRADEAVDSYRQCLDTWSSMRLPLDRAMTVIDAATLLPLDALPEGEAERTRAYLSELGARPLLERLEAALPAPAPAPATPTG